MRDPYAVLGVSKKAGEKEIKSAFRKLAKKHHPDQNQDNPRAKERFAEINAAYEIVGDNEKRAQFDRGEIDAEGKPKFAGFEGFGGEHPFGGFEFRKSGGRGSPFGTGGGNADMGGAEDILKEIFGSAFGGAAAGGRAGFGGAQQAKAGPRPKAGSADIKLAAKVSIEDRARGKATAKLPDGRQMAFSLPPEANDGQIVRLAGQGQRAPGRKAGDALVSLSMLPHPRFSADGANLRVNAEVPLETAVNGGKITVDTLDGKVSLKVPPWTDSGTSFRLKGKGLPAKSGGHGDLLVSAMIVLPKQGREALQEALNEATSKAP